MERPQPYVYRKGRNWDGEGDILAWNARMRDELDNTQTLIALLEARGLEQLSHAERAEDEDTFLLGPDIIDQLRTKTRLMREHWLDIQAYLAPPHK